MSLKEKIKSHEKLKNLTLWMLRPPNNGKPRLWVKIFLNPFIHKKGRGSKVRYRTRIDVIPYNNFKVGKGSTIESFSTINNGVGDVVIGDRSRVGIGDVIIGPVNIGNDVIIAQNVVISGLNHDYENISIPISWQKVSTSPIIIEDEVWIGANAVITAGVTIGKHSVIAAGCVVVDDVPPYSVVVGNPGKIIKQYNNKEKKWIRISK